ncbi:MAG TPA: metalloregulator ArsR/SmtB family transcription factor [Bryobacteraceae bacterium]|nr:metalloregulator ArsR/SmtB family transcription factor [Bryobacteraceae bacterium]
MSSILKSMRLLAEPNRARLLLLLEREELSVAELQEILSKGQSQISTLLAQLKNAGLVEDRRTGKSIYYKLKPQAETVEQLLQLLRRAAEEIPEAGQDMDALRLVLRKRQDKMRGYFDDLAGKFGKHYVPGRSWKGLAEALLQLLPPMTIADLGAGEGTLAQLMAVRAVKVIAVDHSEKMVQYGADLAAKHGIRNLEYRQGDLEDLPIENSSVDLAFFSQALHHAHHPERAVAEAARILRPGGRILILDLMRHGFAQARELYADVWLGFTEVELQRLLVSSCFRNVQTLVVHKEQESPHFETLLASGER